MSQNFVVNSTEIINASEETPVGLTFYFDRSPGALGHSSIENTLNYWAKSTAITGNNVGDKYWSDYGKRVFITFDFEKGNFKGNLLHHNAIGLGDSDFKIGLVKLFCDGYTPKTGRGKGVLPSVIIPTKIEFIYGSEIV